MKLVKKYDMPANGKKPSLAGLRLQLLDVSGLQPLTLT